MEVWFRATLKKRSLWSRVFNLHVAEFSSSVYSLTNCLRIWSLILWSGRQAEILNVQWDKKKSNGAGERLC